MCICEMKHMTFFIFIDHNYKVIIFFTQSSFKHPTCHFGNCVICIYLLQKHLYFYSILFYSSRWYIVRVSNFCRLETLSNTFNFCVQLRSEDMLMPWTKFFVVLKFHVNPFYLEDNIKWIQLQYNVHLFSFNELLMNIHIILWEVVI
jgi:hypothetical protein